MSCVIMFETTESDKLPAIVSNSYRDWMEEILNLKLNGWVVSADFA